MLEELARAHRFASRTMSFTSIPPDFMIATSGSLDFVSRIREMLISLIIADISQSQALNSESCCVTAFRSFFSKWSANPQPLTY